MAAPHNYSNTAVETELTVDLDGTATEITVAKSTGFPSVPFTLILSPDASNEEGVLVTGAISATRFTVLRGYDGYTALPHGTGSKVKHGVLAEDFRLASRAAHRFAGVTVVTKEADTWGDLL